MAGYIGSKASVINSGVENKKVITATAGQTSFTGLTYSPNRVHVFQNGVRLVDGTDYTATDGTSLTLTVGALADDQVVVVSYSGFTVGDVVPASTGGTFSNPVTIDADGSTVLTVDRATSNGTIIDLQKSGSSVGVIGVNGDRIYLTNAQEGIMIDQSANNLSPTSSTGTFNDNAMNLGESGNRWKDLYLSGGVYLGGTGAANKISDYETGTWTPVLKGSGGNPTVSYGNQQGYYTKIGNQVTAHCFISGSFTGGSGGAQVGGLPYNTTGANNFTFSTHVWWEPINMGDTGRQIALYASTNTDTLRLYALETNGTAQDAQVQWSQIGGIEIRFSFTYFV